MSRIEDYNAVKTYKDISFYKTVNYNGGANIKLCLFVVDGLLVDCGPQIMEEELAPFLLNAGVKMAAVTHLHEDHCGNAAWVEKNLKVPIYIHPGDVAEASRDGQYAEYRRITWGDRPAFKALPMPEFLSTGKYCFQAINTPGHMPNHQVLFEPNEGWLFSGDLYIREKLRFCYAGEDLKLTIETLKEVLKLDFDTVFCGHSGVLEDGRERLKRKLDFLLGLQEQVYSLRSRGLGDREIALELFPDNQIIAEISGGEWSSLNVVRSI